MVEWLAEYGTTAPFTLMTAAFAFSALGNLCFIASAWRNKQDRHTLAEIGPMLAAERKRRGMTQEQAGADCGVPYATFGKHERGRPVKTIEVLGKLAAWLGKEGRDFL